jgi:formylmethanofuran dehydrogenase subunit E
MTRILIVALLAVLPGFARAVDRLPTLEYHRQSSDPEWLSLVVQFHGHLGPAVVAGARMGMIGLRAVKARGYFDVEVTCEGPLAKPPQACFLDGIQVATGATMGKRTLTWVQSDRLAVRIKNTRTGQMIELRPAPALMELLASFKSQTRAEVGHGPGQQDHERLEMIARKIAALPEQEIASLAAVQVKEGATAEAPHISREGIEWCNVWITEANGTKLPRVLLIGDSITGGYGQPVADSLSRRRASSCLKVGLPPFSINSRSSAPCCSLRP